MRPMGCGREEMLLAVVAEMRLRIWEREEEQGRPEGLEHPAPCENGERREAG
ncbi:unnamed protein product, partial [Urochloa humidicola]